MLKKLLLLIITPLLIPFSFIYPKERIEKGLFEMYAEEDLAKCSMFQGSFSNFGYWEHIPLDNLTNEQRIESQKNLYRYVLDHLDLDEDDKVLEVGSGKGLGARALHDEYLADTYIGLDLSSHQIQEAKKINRDLLLQEKTYNFIVGQAEKMPFDNTSFTKLFSVETVQHVYPLENFIFEAERILKQNGRIVFAAPFATNNSAKSALKEQIQTIHDDITHATNIEEVKGMLKQKGFVDIHVEAIGEYVFDGFDTWLTQGEYKDSWYRNWKKAYNEGNLDYYVVSAYKPVKIINV